VRCAGLQRAQVAPRQETTEFSGSFMFDLLLFRCFPEVWRGRFGLFSLSFFYFWRWLFTLLGGG
jgi:hypothetical protein